MQEKDRTTALKYFADYYQTASFDIPYVEKREFGIGNWKKIDSRHLGFANEPDFRAYLVKNTPFFVSHSTAYYKYPDATPIDKKNWEKADLVFDLDFHSEGKYDVYSKLGQVKHDAIRLAEEFLISDFGISKKNIHYVFSGNRGYHIHVVEDDFATIGSDERREIADYIMGRGLDHIKFFDVKELRPKVFKIESGPRADESGYRGRFARAVIEMLQNKPSDISRTFSKEEVKNRFIEGIREGNWNKQPYKPNDLFERLRPIAERLALRSVDTDAGVTHDIKKLIRVPNSIHGDTGLIAKRVTVGDIEKFEPLHDAILPLKGTLKIKFTEDVPEISIHNETHGPFKKETENELPEAVGLFFVLRGSAIQV